ncbi:hypothetical protein ACFFHH_07425 [Cytobacillus solani]|uniref:hypothetical protein n=1 Tax=Cytobacillus solani TaxID=1637975 RepID=UPI000A593BF9|nr:hypothetical protein [Cytobacillus solani]USK53363.1 hypothetical protein LIS82_17340 [Cytobacillus solani]
MTSISRAIAEVKEDLNKEESMILVVFSRFLNGLFKVSLGVGIPLLVYLVLQLSNLR